MTIDDERARVERAVASLREPSGDSVGTIRVAPAGIGTAVRIQQPNGDEWFVIDAYGPWEKISDDEAREWPIVYSPTLQCGCVKCTNAAVSAGQAIFARMIVCSECGNKRCPHATDHRLACTGSNEPGQEGSVYA